MYYNVLKTFALMFVLSLIFLAVGSFLGGKDGLTIAFFMALAMNGFSYFYSDKVVLKMYNAKPLEQSTYPHIYEDVTELSKKMNMHVPKIWLVNSPIANSFATGRNPNNASIAYTTGILNILDRSELRGVTAHELSHVKNRDILIGSIAATMATAITYLASMARYAAFWGSASSSSDRDQRSNNPIALLVIAFIAPLAASLVQLGISRSREFQADQSGAELTQEPLALASALEKLELHAHRTPMQDNVQYAPTSALGIVKAFSTRGIMALFATHPPMIDRVRRLHAINKQLFRS
jgi:heat shock protein HtpX